MNHKNTLPNTDTAIQQWLQYLQSEQAAADTIAAYRRDLAHLTRLYPLPSPARYAPNHLQFALGQLQAQGIQARSLARMLSAWRNFFNWFSQHYQTNYNPTLHLRAPSGPIPAPKILSITHTEKLLNAIPAEDADAVAWRDQAMFELLYSSGLRLAELVALDTHPFQTPHYQSKAWVDLETAEVTIHTKEERQRTLPIGSKAITALKKWLDKRAELVSPAVLHSPLTDMDSAAALFLGVRGQRISPRVIQKQLQQRAQQVGIPKPVFPHRLRNSFANHLLESSNDTQGVQQLLGHANISSTQSLSQLSDEQRAQFLKLHPRHQRPPET